MIPSIVIPVCVVGVSLDLSRGWVEWSGGVEEWRRGGWGSRGGRGGRAGRKAKVEGGEVGG